MAKIFVKETNAGTFILRLNNEETKGIAYSDSSELSPEELREFDFDGCIKNGNGFEIFEGEQLQECMDCKTVKILD